MARKGDRVGLGSIYTEKIHHLTCNRCKESINTNDCSHEISKAEAAYNFELVGWRYKYLRGWWCPTCLLKK